MVVVSRSAAHTTMRRPMRFIASDHSLVLLLCVGDRIASMSDKADRRYRFFISEEALRNTFRNYAVLILPFCILISINKLIAFNPGLFGRLSFVKFLLVKPAFVAREIKILATSLTLQCRPLSDTDVRRLRDKRSSLMWVRQGV